MSSFVRSAAKRISSSRVKFSVQARSVATIQDAVTRLVPEWREDIKDLRGKHGDKVLCEVTVDQAIGGMRGIKGMITETSLLDPEEGIRFRGYSIPECQKLLPTAPGGKEPLPEALFWLLITGEIPSTEEVKGLSADLMARSTLPAHTRTMIDSFPKDMHPMTQLCSAVLAMQTESKFAEAYMAGTISKQDYWTLTLEDSLDLIAKLPEAAAMIYRNVFKGGDQIKPDISLDWGANYAHMLGYTDPDFVELMRLYLTIHTDHEGGNASAHATHLVGSTLSDPYLSFCGGMTALAGPLHGLANQEVLRWLTKFKADLGDKEVTKESITEACWATLKSGNVIPGFGHAVLRKTDPRYMCQREFALEKMPDDEMFKLVSTLYEVVPGVLTETGKVKNPWPNVDAHSGVLLQYYGFTEAEYYTVLFGVSRALGVLASLVIDRALGLPLERPKSMTTQWIREQFQKK
mmetsp:Transcript_5029/g.9264  ORF Transcript_5029/g.9264 Transcript_5029/m.9264 type:complete len:462 (-) Transcript_5029:167-1552(-)|eukprot:CAMPEP_0197541322 /NCGR_PEP_ID=MMETSP1318-20131121/67054_1 /TAXON_ID=552666 /ORGANISM="Partenskyella glossopodia, Strain RCC365" /LENGTH=461 /DNA_ID=CAMNT_0043100485 /DNA_START=66 /DNA_END=1451 /DNA_ORIENTATION=+